MPLHAYSGKCNDLHVYSIRELLKLSYQTSVFSQLVLSTHPLLFYQLLPSYLTVVIFSTVILSNLCNLLFTFFFYLRFTKSTHMLYASDTLRQYTLANNRYLWTTCHSDLWESRRGAAFERGHREWLVLRRSITNSRTSTLSRGLFKKPHNWAKEVRIGKLKVNSMNHCGPKTLQQANHFKIALFCLSCFPCRHFFAENFVLFFTEIKLLLINFILLMVGGGRVLLEQSDTLQKHLACNSF